MKRKVYKKLPLHAIYYAAAGHMNPVSAKNSWI